ncbi:MAG: TRIC cation channel family protein [Anaerolineae bacterium]|nr:TRIC cation channel family protein [Anaerolineae bacterium]
MLLVLTWAGTLTFAVAGALTAIEKEFDLVGVTVLALATAVGGGAIRDVVVGKLPPSALQNEPLIWAVVGAALVVFTLHTRLEHTGLLRNGLFMLDTIGLGVFAALGAERGIDAGLGLWGVLFTGVVSGVGGGMLRDIFAGEVPGILYRASDFYASAAAGGALVTFLLYPRYPGAALIAGSTTVIALRFGARLLRLRLPVSTPRPRGGKSAPQ